MSTDRRRSIICDQTIALDSVQTKRTYREHLRRVGFHDPGSGKSYEQSWWMRAQAAYPR